MCAPFLIVLLSHISSHVFILQGIDIDHRYKRKVYRRGPKSNDVYIKLLVKVREGNVHLLMYYIIA